MQFHECAFDFCGDEFAGLATMFSSCFSRLRPHRRSATIHQTFLWGPISWALFGKKGGELFQIFRSHEILGWRVLDRLCTIISKCPDLFCILSAFLFIFAEKSLPIFRSPISHLVNNKVWRAKDQKAEKWGERRGTTHFPINLPPLTDYYTPST